MVHEYLIIYAQGTNQDAAVVKSIVAASIAFMTGGRSFIEQGGVCIGLRHTLSLCTVRTCRQLSFNNLLNNISDINLRIRKREYHVLRL
jgi:hypothetical protein